MPPDPTPAGLPDFAPGAIFGPYRIVRMLGRGGMGAVYEAEHQDDGRIVALKLLTVELDKMDSRERFLREGQTAATINHPNAVYIYGTEEIDGTPAITMELVPGGTLEDKVKANGPLPVNEAIEDILQVIDGLDAALGAGVLHRDVKPSNCFVGANGAVKIGDFGLSKPVDSEEQQKLTKTGLFLGTPVYSSPEQLLGESLDARSDIYAVGVTFYHLLTAKLPYTSESMMQVVAAVLNGAPAPVSSHRPDLPKNVADVVMKALARKPADRFQNYAEFRAAVMALRATDVGPATLWDRFRAVVIDDLVVVGSLMWVVTHTVAPSLSANAIQRGESNGVATALLSLALSLLIIGVPESLRGQSIGKWIIGIRIVGPGGGVPGFARALGRVLILSLADFAVLSLKFAIDDPRKQAPLILLASLLFRTVWLVTARRSNGRRMLHDFLTGTRVVRPRVAATQRRGEAHRVVAPTLTGNEPRTGPYVVLGPAEQGSTILRGWDATVHRVVWIVPRPAGLAETSHERRALARLTRLRWVGGRRQENNSWDAYEAPVGEPLGARLIRSVPWSVQRDWLHDLCSELAAGQKDGTALVGVSANSLWVTPTDRIVFPEGVEAAALSTATNPLSLVHDVLDRIRAAPAPAVPLPRHALQAISSIRATNDPAVALTILNETLGKPVEVTRLRRGALIAATILPVVLFSALGWFSTSQGSRLDRAGYIRAGLIGFVEDSLSTTPDSVRGRAAAEAASAKPFTRIRAALQRLGVMHVVLPDTITSPDSLREQRLLAEAYLATAYPAAEMAAMTDTLANANPRGVFALNPKDRRKVAVILARNRQVDSATARAARVLVDSVWKGEVPGNGAASILTVIGIVIAFVFLYFAATMSLLAALLARRGPLMRGFQVDVVNLRGEPAGRLRMIARMIVTWSPTLVPCAIYYTAITMTIATLATVIVVANGLAIVLWAAALAYTIRKPGRGVAERVTGTYLVPE